MQRHASRIASMLFPLILLTACASDDGESSGSGDPCRNAGVGTYTITPAAGGKRAEVVDDYRFACYDDLVGCLVACYDDCPDETDEFFRFGVGGSCPTEFAAAVGVAAGKYRFYGTRLRAFNGSSGPFASGTYQLYDQGDNLIEEGTFTFVESGFAATPPMGAGNACP